MDDQPSPEASSSRTPALTSSSSSSSLSSSSGSSTGLRTPSLASSSSAMSSSSPPSSPTASAPSSSFTPVSSSPSSPSSSKPALTLSGTSYRPSPFEPSLPPPPVSLREPPGPDLIPGHRPTLAQFRASEGPDTRSSKLRTLWANLPTLPHCPGDEPTPTKLMKLPGQDTATALSPERAERLRRLYEEELVRRVREKRPEARLWGGPDDLGREKTELERQKEIEWSEFRKFLWDQESQLWDIFQELDKNGDGRLDAVEMRAALSRSGIDITPATVRDLVGFLASGQSAGDVGNSAENQYVTFQEFRDFLIMLPRKATPSEIYKFYQVRKRFSDGRGAARVDKEGDINVSFPKAPIGGTSVPKHLDDDDNEEYADGGEVVHEDRHEAWRFLLAGGVAGAVSRSVTAPFDRLKIYLITTDERSFFSDPKYAHSTNPLRKASSALANLWGAVGRIYTEGGGVRAFWVGNGLNVLKIFPESAIRFYAYEKAKLLLAKYHDHVTDPSELSSASRFIAGGLGGITSQFAIYGVETLKTRVQSDIGPSMGWRHVVGTAQGMWRQGGLRAYYRGLTLGLIGVFPYSALDMTCFETLKYAYCRSTGLDEPPTFATLSFGAFSGSFGAATVYPINLLRTRLQASGSSGHQHAYTGFRDVLRHTLKNEGWRGLYKGLLPSILKVGPAMGVSWAVYESAKKRLGV